MAQRIWVLETRYRYGRDEWGFNDAFKFRYRADEEAAIRNTSSCFEARVRSYVPERQKRRAKR